MKEIKLIACDGAICTGVILGDVVRKALFGSWHLSQIVMMKNQIQRKSVLGDYKGSELGTSLLCSGNKNMANVFHQC